MDFYFFTEFASDKRTLVFVNEDEVISFKLDLKNEKYTPFPAGTLNLDELLEFKKMIDKEINALEAKELGGR
jgi:hypothetical protein